jgi:hypothetical protein
VVSTPVLDSTLIILFGLMFITIASILKNIDKKRIRESLHLYLKVLVFGGATAGVLSATTASGYSVKIGWDPNEEPDIKGYILYGSQDSPCPPYYHIDNYPEKVLVNPLTPMVKVTELEKNVTYYFALTAYNSFESESDYSNVVYVLDGKSGNAICSSEKSNSGGGGGGGG